MELKYTSLLADSTLKGYWRINEIGGTAVSDSSGEGHNGTASRTNILSGTSGKYGACGTFVSASSDKITVSNHADFNITGNFSISAWIKTSTNAVMGILTKGAAAAYSWGLQQNGNVASISLWQQAGATFMTVNGATTVNDGNWHHVVATYDGTTLRIYTDTNVQSTTTKTGSWYNGTADIIIGGRADGANYYNGNIDDVNFFNNKVLSTAEIAKLYQTQPRSSIIFNLASNWKNN